MERRCPPTDTKATPSIAFIANAIGNGHEPFLVPFAYFALSSHPDGFVEIVVADPARYQKAYARDLQVLGEHAGRFLVRGMVVPINGKHSLGTYRFFEHPTVHAKYTWIGDIDVMLLENVIPKQLKSWTHGLPYNNFRRPNSERLTGVHFVETERYFTKEFLKMQRITHSARQGRLGDEGTLGMMCKKVHGLIDSEHQVDRIQGIHFSPNRGPGKRMALATSKQYSDMFCQVLAEHKLFAALPVVQQLHNQLLSEFHIK